MNQKSSKICCVSFNWLDPWSTPGKTKEQTHFISKVIHCSQITYFSGIKMLENSTTCFSASNDYGQPPLPGHVPCVVQLLLYQSDFQSLKSLLRSHWISFQSHCDFGTVRIVIFFWSFWNFTPLILVVWKKTSKTTYFIDYGGNHHIKL